MVAAAVEVIEILGGQPKAEPGTAAAIRHGKAPAAQRPRLRRPAARRNATTPVPIESSPPGRLPKAPTKAV